MHITRGGPRDRIGGLALAAGPQPASRAEGAVCDLSSVPAGPPTHITLVSLLFHVIVFIPKNIF